MSASEPTGLELARLYVLGLDDVMSRDHDCGLRLSLFVPADAVTAVG
ncbi:hypothetical protein [Agromyces atrinae]|uniref:Uncharacterized protein n=1 Tax=Agromyces atrinae TaxID=592376 RepID=A0A852S9X5_9MICO|nr:hypothetical protein [Agromyces atrinae]NYD65614.1 hypothetical protein [Agromyces atrinae]